MERQSNTLSVSPDCCDAKSTTTNIFITRKKTNQDYALEVDKHNFLSHTSLKSQNNYAHKKEYCNRNITLNNRLT